jgi:hypothetical protein
MIHDVLPVQHQSRAQDGLATPQRRLMVAVLQTVLDDCQGTAYARAMGVKGGATDRALHDAVAYVASRDRSWPFSFENLCEAIGIDPDGIRVAVGRCLPLAR